MRVALLCCLPRRGWFLVCQPNNNSALHVSYMFLSPQLSLITFKWSEHGAVFSVSGNVNPEWIQSGVITECLERREERALIHSRLWSHPPQQTEYTSSFLHLTPIQAEIKTVITLFEKCKRIYGLKVMKSEFKKAGTLQLTGIRRIDGEL